MRKYLLVTCLLLTSLIILPISLAATLKLNKIGALDLGGKMYSEWWYTAINPTFSGEAEANSTVKLKTGDIEYSATSDGSGKWSIGTSMEKGDYNVAISQGDEKISFVLHIGQNVPTDLSGSVEATESTVSVPNTGFNQYFALMFSAGILLLGSYLYMWGSEDTKSFEKKIIDES